VVVVAAVGGYFVLPPRASATETFTVERPPESVFAYLASTPAGTEITPGVTLTEVTSAENNVVVANVAFADQTTGTATYTVSAEGAGSQIALKIDQPLGPNPLDRVQALTGGEVKPLADAAATAINTQLTALPPASFQGLAYEVTTVAAKPFLSNRGCSPTQASEIKEAVAQSLVVLRPIMARYNLQQDGPPIAVEESWNEAANQYCFQIGFAFTGTPPRLYAGGTVGQTPAGQVMRVHYEGPEERVIPTYDQMEALIAAARLTRGKSFEIYYDDPTAVGGSVTRDIYYLVTGDTSRLQAVAPSAAAVPASTTLAPQPSADPAAAAAPAAATTPAPAPAAPPATTP
jgi:hypothetical protein